MKKLLNLSFQNYLFMIGFSVALLGASIWHQNQNSIWTEKISALSVGTQVCFSRVNQSFTAYMIKDKNSPYLQDDFMKISDECLKDSLKTATTFKTAMPKVYTIVNTLANESFWFHQKILKLATQTEIDQNTSNSIMSKFEYIEGQKIDLLDELDIVSMQAKESQKNDIWITLASMMLMILTLGLLTTNEWNRRNALKKIENQAMTLLNTGKANIASFIDDLMNKALTTTELKITSQVFAHYHEGILERKSVNMNNNVEVQEKIISTLTPDEKMEVKTIENTTDKLNDETSMVSSLVNKLEARLQDYNTTVRCFADKEKNPIDRELVEQLIFTIVQKISSDISGPKSLVIYSQAQDTGIDFSVFAKGVILTASELEAMNNPNAKTIGINTELILLKELLKDQGLNFSMSNKLNDQGFISGVNFKVNIPYLQKHQTYTKKLKSVVKAKKKDLKNSMTTSSELGAQA